MLQQLIAINCGVCDNVSVTRGRLGYVVCERCRPQQRVKWHGQHECPLGQHVRACSCRPQIRPVGVHASVCQAGLNRLHQRQLSAACALCCAHRPFCPRTFDSGNSGMALRRMTRLSRVRRVRRLDTDGAAHPCQGEARLCLCVRSEATYRGINGLKLWTANACRIATSSAASAS